MEATGKKRFKRSSNFTKQEEMLLVQEVEKFKTIIECKVTDRVNNHDKNEAWLKITAQFNAKGPSQQVRSLEQLKSKYDNLKTRARKTAADNRKHVRGTGGGPSKDPDWDPVIEAILRIINEKTVIGFYTEHDSDAFHDAEAINRNNIEVVQQCDNVELVLEDFNKENIDPVAVEDFEVIQGNTATLVVEDFVIQENTATLAVEDFDAIPSSSGQKVTLKRKVEALNNQNVDIQASSETNWSKYTPKKLKTPVSRKLRPTIPISTSMHIAKQAYYEQRNILLGEEIKLKQIQQEDHRRKIQREEEEHDIKMKILKCELKLKEKELNTVE